MARYLPCCSATCQSHPHYTFLHFMHARLSRTAVTMMQAQPIALCLGMVLCLRGPTPAQGLAADSLCLRSSLPEQRCSPEAQSHRCSTHHCPPRPCAQPAQQTSCIQQSSLFALKLNLVTFLPISKSLSPSWQSSKLGDNIFAEVHSKQGAPLPGIWDRGLCEGAPAHAGRHPQQCALWPSLQRAARW